MTNLVEEYLKNKLEDYRYWHYILKTTALKKYELDVIRGLHSVAPKEVCVQGTSDSLNKELRRLELIDAYDKNEQELKTAIVEMKAIQRILLNIKDKSLVLPIFNIHCLKSSTYSKEAKKLFIHEKTLQRKVNRELRKILERN